MSVLRNVSGNLLSFQEHKATLDVALHGMSCCDQLLLSSSVASFLKRKKYNSWVRHSVGLCSCVYLSGTLVCLCLCVCVCLCVRALLICIWVRHSLGVCTCVCVCACVRQSDPCLCVCLVCVYVYIYIRGSAALCMCVYLCASFSRYVYVNICV